jgi:monooxygenase
VLIVGAGLSGIGAARHLQRRCPGRRWAIVEARPTLGGTWDLFRYPGIRSDSDMYTLGYDFKPWRAAKAIADGPSILQYIRETADEAGITPQIRFGHKVLRADWHSADACWTVTLQHTDATTGVAQQTTQRARFLYLCSGYYSYAAGHRPRFDGEADFRGRIVEPQFWPADLQHAGQRVVVVGSGATAVTLVPELAKTAAQVTMLQRSPTYVVNRPSVDAIAQRLNRWLPAGLAYTLTRWKNVLVGRFYYGLARKRPGAGQAAPGGPGRRRAGQQLRRAGALQPALQPLGPAGVRGARRRHVPADPRRAGRGGHRHHQPLHRHRAAAAQRARRPTSSTHVGTAATAWC